MIKQISITSKSSNELIEITDLVMDELRIFQKNYGPVKEGQIVIFVLHTTAAITINENADNTVQKDMLGKIAELVPKNDSYKHLEGNSDAHIKSSSVLL